MELGRGLGLSSDKRPHDLKNNYKMKTFVFNFWMACILVSANACDPDTQYENVDGVCCDMCRAGTRMAKNASCKDPNCIPCGEHEYQPGFTRENRCKLQPYCDPNLNLDREPLDPKKRAACTCKSEHHWSSEEYLTCVPNTACKPGEGVHKMAKGFNDTVCRACDAGTFSNESSAVKSCRKWKTCDEKTERIKTSGTPTSNVECEKITPNVGLAVGLPVCILIAVAIAVAVAVVFRCLKKDRNCLKNIFKKENPGDMKHHPLMQPEEELLQKPVWLENENRTGQGQDEGPVENEETQPCPMRDLTENNKPLRQEEGKTEHISQAESEEPSTDFADSTYVKLYP